ncbi:hypothetical protein COV93_03890 [Candidatus Woesearchaeota archaeon CG11_big_fil_rev_8_21_14_0_20_43_8]|nr:MAG: hypothetical protein COV93_03890 [Candidatus Woesearchaeota archaeon CG11_big_fil_rev_8_21_14_0_20_43_8]
MPKKKARATRSKGNRKIEAQPKPQVTKTEKKKTFALNKEVLMLLGVLVVILFVIGIKSYSSGDDVTSLSDSMAKIGDNVSIRYAGRYLDGTLFDTNIVGLPEKEGLNGFNVRDSTFDFVIGKGQAIPGMEIAVVGMKIGDHKRVTIEPKDAYGTRVESAQYRWPSTIIRNRAAHVGRSLLVDARVFAQMLGSDLKNSTFLEGQTIHADWTNVDYYVEKVTGTNVQLRIDVDEGDTIYLPNTAWNSTVTWMNSSMFIVRQNPVLSDVASTQWGDYAVTEVGVHNYTLSTMLSVGDKLMVNNKYGTIKSIDAENVTFDANHPLAGETLVFDIDMVDIKRPIYG